MPGTPAVSIVTAAYNRSNVVRCAVESVRAGTFCDWELIVVGDHCTDDTREIVEEFGDPRVRFLNLPENTGGQSDPNNMGVSLARGRYLCFLNQDDLYFPDHLASSIEFMESAGADLIWSAVAVSHPENRNVDDPSRLRMSVEGVTPSGGYDPAVLLIASSWFMRREVAQRVGPWVPGRQTFLPPSQEWLFRASRRGVVMRFKPRITVLCIHAGYRRNAYELREYRENERFLHWLRNDPDFPRMISERAGIVMAGAIREAVEPGMLLALRRLGWAVVRRLCGILGVHPVTLTHLVRYGGRGGFLRYVRSVGFPERVLRRGETLQVGEAGAEKYLKAGWHAAEGTHRWTAASTAVIGLDRERGAPFRHLAICGAPLFVPQTVEFHVSGNCAGRHHFVSAAEESVRVPVETAEARIELSIRVERVATPKELHGSPDERLLGFRMVKIAAE